MDAVPQNIKEVSALKLRIKFKKFGHLKFIGHLDTMRYFQKLIRRSEIDIKYSEGFSPHQIMSFAFPLGVGMLSVAEYVDIECNSITSTADVKEALNKHSVEGFEIVNVIVLPDNAKNAMASVGFADYSIEFRDGFKPNFDLADAINKFYNEQSTIIVTKETKKSTKEVDLKEGIKALSTSDGKIFMKLTASSGNNIKPELVIKSLYDFMGEDYDELYYEITRLELYDENLVPLDYLYLQG